MKLILLFSGSSHWPQGDTHEPWLEQHADFERVFLIGDSSGGNIVHEVVARAGKIDLTPLKLAGAIPIQPGFVRSYRSKSEIDKPQSPMLILDMVDKFLGFALPVDSNKDHPLTCPGVRGSSTREPQPASISAMKKVDKDIELFVNTGMMQTQNLITAIKKFIEKH